MPVWREQALALIDRRWKLVVLIAWVAFCAWFVLGKWIDVVLFNLVDTDDNMRLMQVRGLLHGQHWFDLRQYRLNPPAGANMHWSRLVDLPIAGLIVGFRLFVDEWHAERLAVGIAPMLPYLPLLFSLALTARRLIAPRAYPLVFVTVFFAPATNEMFMPERIDHHGWQLALLALSIASIADPKRARGGLTLGISTALSLAIGLEMIVYLAVAAAAMLAFWVVDAAERERLRAYAVSLALTTVLCFLVFTSYDNRGPVCDALSPVWLSDIMVGAALSCGLTFLSPADWRKRLALGLAVGIVVATFHALMWPHCLRGLEGVSPEADRLWLSKVAEARPFYLRYWRIAVLIIALPITGLIGWGVLAWSRRKDRDQLRSVLATAAPAIAATLLVSWESRTSEAAQMMAVVGCAAFIWFLVPLAWNLKPRLLALPAAGLLIVIGSGFATSFVVSSVPLEVTPRDMATARAVNSCRSMWAMRGVGLQPRGIVFTFIDLGPRLITVTPHDAIAGPYHRNGQQIVDVIKAFIGSEPQAHRLITKYRSNYILTCPDSPSAQSFIDQAPDGFYARIDRGEVPNWLAPIQLPDGSPFKMWRVVA